MAASRNELLVRVGRRLRQMREESGRTQEEVGERAGFSGKYVSEIERGLRDPPLTTLVRIAEQGLGGRVEQLLSSPNPVRPGPIGSHQSAGAADRDATPAAAIQRLAGQLSSLPEATRRRVLRLIRGVLQLAAMRGGRAASAPRRDPRKR
jgi:transcriptional regulator with XRE-family HTH domain